MFSKTPLLLSAALGLILLLGGCAGSNGVRVTEGNQQIGSSPTGSVFATTEATVVHVDLSERLVTLRNGRVFPAITYLETRGNEGTKTGLLKTRSNRSTGLRTADILEGEPQINNRAAPVSPAESRRLADIYGEPTVD